MGAGGSMAMGPVELQRRLDEVGYLADDGLATALSLSLALGQPILLEGEPGVGKTAAAKALSRALGTPLIRLQCYEGVTAGEALYEWNYQRQILAIRLAESRHEQLKRRRPVHRGVPPGAPDPEGRTAQAARAPVLLIDEIDRADDEFEALLFEFLGEASVTVPEIGTFTAERPPDRRAHLEPQPGAARRPAAALPLPLDRVPRPGSGWPTYCAVPSPPPASRSSPLRPSSWAGYGRLDLDKAPGLAESIDWLSALSVPGGERAHRGGRGAHPGRHRQDA